MAAASSYRPVLLIVEDDDLLREAIASVLAHTDCEVVVTASGEEALALIAEIGSFDGLYTDINLSGAVDGWEVGEVFHRRCPSAPIIYASARTWPNTRVAPSGTFLRKPFTLYDLAATLLGRKG